MRCQNGEKEKAETKACAPWYIEDPTSFPNLSQKREYDVAYFPLLAPHRFNLTWGVG
jgi:hypothetical protein